MKLPRYWKPAVISIVIIVLCLIPSSEMQRFDILEISYMDLVGHLGIFFIFSALLIKDLRKYNPLHDNNRLLIIASLICLVLGISTEFLQFVLVSLNRTANFYDLMFDCFGSLLGMIFVRSITRKSGPGS